MHNFWQPVRKAGFILSLCLLFTSIITFYISPISLGLDFTGGYILDFTLPTNIQIADLKNELAHLTHETFTLSHMHAHQWRLLFLPSVHANDVSVFQTALESHFNATIIESKFLGAQVGEELKVSGALAALFAIISILIYLIIRFEWRLAVAAMVALFHDILLTVTLLSFLNITFDLTVLAALLAIVGYSLNDSIIIGDRIRELIRAKPHQLVSHSINEALQSTLRRTLITSFTTLATVLAIWLLGGEALNGFATALLIGLTAGTLSSVFISATLPEFMGLGFENYQNHDSDEVKRRLAEP
ncbi:preprotein translocase subunit SecF [Pseudoalteromonas citrea]|uniref:Protein-export membrane protein SecF n=2 Tax=Pseudoalteromonas citrea TaxID=43655 RepID=A0AAD4FRF5_9GAMM|nr:protein translocase subunit SecF [Pseudoalteromonas citrea]KAF7769822.1 preprotein translocase subunit SecF [Pseudoalteromonas citrea]